MTQISGGESPRPAKRTTRGRVFAAIAVGIILLQAGVIIHLNRLVNARGTIWEMPAPRQSIPLKPTARVECSSLGRDTEVTGRLGRPLGSKIKMTGRVTDPPPIFTSSNEVPFTITSIDGKPCESMSTRFRSKHYFEPQFAVLHNLSQLSNRPIHDFEKGVEYEVVGYETGNFFGPPDWAAPISAQMPFQFSTYFVVVAAERR